MCMALNCLPEEGALFDQDPYWVEAMGLVIQAQNEKEAMEAADMKRQADAARST